MDDYKTFHVGINVFLIKDGSLLLGLRKGVFGDGTWGLVGGHLEPGEGMMEGAARELAEETGLKALKLSFTNLVNDRSGAKHYIQVGFEVDEYSGEPKILEPDRCSELKFFALNNLTKNIFPPHQNQIKLFLEKNHFSDQ